MTLEGRKSVRVFAAVAALALTLGMATACSSSEDKASGAMAVVGQSGTQVNYILPFFGPQYATRQNVQEFQMLMYRPLYWFGVGDNPVLNKDLSLAEEPEWSNKNRTATIHLKDFKWSNGEKLTPRNVAFWLGLAKNEKESWAYYTKGAIPDDLESVTYDDEANTVTFNLNKAVAPYAFLSGELGQIIPMPLAWDLTGTDTKGTCSSENEKAQAASCSKVFDYLTKLAKDQTSYATNELWQIVNGPFQLATYKPGVEYSFRANRKYSGPIKPKLDELTFKYFQSDAAQYNALRSGSIDIGYIPPQNVPRKTADQEAGESPVKGYTLDAVPYFGYNSLQMNFNNPDVGPLFKQLYIRQALQMVVDQDVYVEKAGQGYGYPQYGPIPQQPATPFVSSATKENIYPFDPAKAKQLLESHGWSVPSSGPATCEKPGTGPGQCGADIPAGEKLEFKLEETAGWTRMEQIMQQLASDASSAGISIKLIKETGNQVVGNLIACEPSEATCKWQIINAGGNGYPSPYPSGQLYFSTGANQNFGSYSDQKMDQLISATQTSSDPGTMQAYEEYAQKQIPSIWMPAYPVQISAVSDKLTGVSPLSRSITPDYWARK